MPKPEEDGLDARIAALKGSLLAELPWQSAIAGGLVTRFSTANMVQDQIDAYMGALQKAGFHPKIHESKTLGPTIRLQGTEAAIMDQAHEETMAAKKAGGPRPGPA